MPDQKTMRTRCPDGFSVTWVPKHLLPSIRIRIFGPKRPNLVRNLHHRSFRAKYWHFWPISSRAQPKSNANKVPRWFFHYVGTKTFAFSSKNLNFLLKNDLIWPQIWIFGHYKSKVSKQISVPDVPRLLKYLFILKRQSFFLPILFLPTVPKLCSPPLQSQYQLDQSISTRSI